MSSHVSPAGQRTGIPPPISTVLTAAPKPHPLLLAAQSSREGPCTFSLLYISPTSYSLVPRCLRGRLEASRQEGQEPCVGQLCGHAQRGQARRLPQLQGKGTHGCAVWLAQAEGGGLSDLNIDSCTSVSLPSLS